MTEKRRFETQSTGLAGVKIVLRKPLGDERGCLERLFCAEEMSEMMNGRQILQSNRTRTGKAGTLRGLHFQYPPHAEMKLVSCLRGEVCDVVVDLRRGSPTFLSWHAEILSDANHKTLVIPEGFAHGFQTLVDDCELLYFHTAAHAADFEGGLHALDPRLDISWPLPVAHLSVRDGNHPMLDGGFQGLEI